jgi:cysteine desulfurase/selenocysteine lyase
MGTTVEQTISIETPPPALARAREDFPIFSRTVHDKDLVYLDSAATSHKPRQVIDRLSSFYSQEYGTVRRGSYLLSQQATAHYECVRKKAAGFFNARSADEIVFVRGVTEGINLISHSIGRGLVREGDEIVISEMEHHANIVPWQLLRAQTGIVLKVIPMDDRGQLIMEEAEKLITDRTKIVSVNHVANALGTVNPVKKLTEWAHAVGAWMVVDGAQSACHIPVDVQDLGCDFYICSGHKMLGPTGAGILYGREEVLAQMPPFQGGGEMIDKVDFDESTYDDPPHRFEAGTPAIAEVVGLGAAIDYLSTVGMENVEAWDQVLVDYATKRLREVPDLRIIGEAEQKSGLVAFVIGDLHPFDIAAILDRSGVCIRAGHHCAQPVMRHFGVPATARCSFNVYTVKHEIDALVDALMLAHDMLS